MVSQHQMPAAGPGRARYGRLEPDSLIRAGAERFDCDGEMKRDSRSAAARSPAGTSSSFSTKAHTHAHTHTLKHLSIHYFQIEPPPLIGPFPWASLPVINLSVGVSCQSVSVHRASAFVWWLALQNAVQADKNIILYVERNGFLLPGLALTSYGFQCGTLTFREIYSC